MTDIAFFNHTYTPVCINTDKYQVASLLLPPEINLEDLIKQILNQSTNVQILQVIFEVEPTLSKLANKLYLSETSIRRIIANINTYFCEINAPLSIHISSKLKIIGDESYIRQFFCSMFREQYTPQQLPHFITYSMCYNVTIKSKQHIKQLVHIK
ncbi:helix-turn-helix domain-containing protein [Enterococcus mundtii]|nr:helix-turn-helix domain-containing protein [Enterococcus mundtii]